MHIGKNGTYRTAQPSVRSFAPADILPESQGTNSVHGTWSSEGEAGRHFRTKAQRIGASNPPPVQPRLDRIAEQARQCPKMKFFTLAHHLDVAMLERAFWSLNPKSAAGVDGVTWPQYKRDLELNLEVLHEKLVTKTYQPATGGPTVDS